MARTIAQRRGRAAIGMRAERARYEREGFRRGPGRGTVEGLQEGQSLRPAGGVRRSLGDDEQKGREAIDLHVLATVGEREVLFAREPTEPCQVRVPVEVLKD